MVNKICIYILLGILHLIDVIAIDAVFQQGKHALGKHVVAFLGVCDFPFVVFKLALDLVEPGLDAGDFIILPLLRCFDGFSGPCDLLYSAADGGDHTAQGKDRTDYDNNSLANR